MICDTCKTAAALSDELPLAEAKKLHESCKGSTHCDCQHRPSQMMADGSLAQRRS